MIDWDRVTELRDEIGAEDFKEVVDLFLSEVEETLAQMQADDDAATLQATLHFLKGSALNLGFSTLAKLCQDGEHSAASGNTEGVDTATVVQVYDQAKQRFLSELPVRLAA